MDFEFSGIVTVNNVTKQSLPVHESSGATLRGVVLNAATGYAVGRIRVTAAYSCSEQGSDVPLGEATTRPDGRFEIHFPERVLDKGAKKPPLRIKLASSNGVPMCSTMKEGALRLGSAATVLATLPVYELSAAEWTVLGQRVAALGVTQVHELAEGLLELDGAAAVVPDWTVEQRHAALQGLETEFLDPKGMLRRMGPVPSLAALRTPGGLETYHKQIEHASTAPGVSAAFSELEAKAASFGSLSAVDWVMDVNELQAGAVAIALTKNQDSYQADRTNHPANQFVAVNTDLIKYRNYLRAIFTGAPDSANYASHLQQIAGRFKQDFATTSTAPQPLNEILIPIFKSILTAPTGSGYGFGVLPAAIPTQGTATARAYLDDLIALSGLSRDELENRYRLDLDQPDSALSSRVEVNIWTLQHFYSDGFQSLADPYPIIPANGLGRGPFYLTFPEWSGLNGPFYPENYYQIGRSYDTGAWEEDFDYFKVVAKDPSEDALIQWFAALAEIQTLLADAQKKADQLLYVQAKELYLKAAKSAEGALMAKLQEITEDTWIRSKVLETASSVLAIVTPALNSLLAVDIKKPADLDQDGFPNGCFMEHYRNLMWTHPGEHWDFLHDLENGHAKHRLMLLHLYLYVIPVRLGDLCMATGDYAGAENYYAQTTGFTVGRGQLSDGPGYSALRTGNLPYTAESGTGGPHSFPFTSPYSNVWFEGMAKLLIPDKTHPMERKFLRLRHCGALLEWADALYRSADSSSVARARELYKAVLFAHSVEPGITPVWQGKSPAPFTNHSKNPAMVSQVVRAQKGLEQIENGLNYYGVSDAFVPPVRYQVLRTAADRFAAAAKSAQSDFITSVSQVEEAVKNGMMTANMLRKADLQAVIADEQSNIAKMGVQNAERQVADIEKAIDAKKKEIADHQGLGQQFLDFASGFVDAITELPSALTDGLGQSAAAGAGLGGEVTGSGWMGLGAAGAGVATAGAFGLFVYAGVSGIVASGDAQNSRAAQLAQLRDVALPQAQQIVQVQESQLRITQLQGQLALADAKLARDLIHFQVTRTLTTEFWTGVALVMKRLLRRYLELGARYAWLAERALEYEQDRAIDIVRFDYFPAKTSNVTGPDLLALDLAELEASRLSYLRETVPVKLTYSLAADFPFSFQKLKKTGACDFWPSEALVRAGYPGVYGYRLRAATVALQSMVPRAGARGILTNQGVSVISRRDGSSHLSVRTPDALPFSDFNVHNDAVVYGLPGETLLNFEGSGLESWWRIEFPKAANRQGLEDITDVLVTFDMTSSYAPELYAPHLASAPTTARSFALFSCASLAPAALDKLKTEPGLVGLPFDLANAKLNPQEKNRRVTNVLVALASPQKPPVNVTLAIAQPALTVNVALAQGIAISNAPPFNQGNSPAPASPLNVLVNAKVDQLFTLTIDKAAYPGVDFASVVDVVLGIEYSAELT